MRAVRTVALILSHVTVATLAGIGFKLFSASIDAQGFWLWQILGNIAGFVGVLVLTALMRLRPLHVAYPITQGLATVGVQVFAARLVFHEVIRPGQWVGSGLVVVGIVLISVCR